MYDAVCTPHVCAGVNISESYSLTKSPADLSRIACVDVEGKTEVLTARGTWQQPEVRLWSRVGMWLCPVIAEDTEGMLRGSSEGVTRMSRGCRERVSRSSQVCTARTLCIDYTSATRPCSTTTTSMHLHPPPKRVSM